MRRSTTLVAAFATLMCAAVARAEKVEWGYSVDRDRPAIEADVPGTGGITLTNELFRTAAGNSDIVLTSLSTFSSAAFDTPDVFTNSPFALTLTLTDVASGASGSMTFSGMFSGILSRAFSQIETQFTGTTEGSLTLGNNTYTVRLNTVVPPPVPGAANPGSIGARVTVTGGSGEPPPPPPPVDTPEPSSLVLAGLGLAGLGLRSVRKWRAKA